MKKFALHTNFIVIIQAVVHRFHLFIRRISKTGSKTSKISISCLFNSINFRMICPVNKNHTEYHLEKYQ